MPVKQPLSSSTKFFIFAFIILLCVFVSVLFLRDMQDYNNEDYNDKEPYLKSKHIQSLNIDNINKIVLPKLSKYNGSVQVILTENNSKIGLEYYTYQDKLDEKISLTNFFRITSSANALYIDEIAEYINYEHIKYIEDMIITLPLSIKTLEINKKNINLTTTNLLDRLHVIANDKSSLTIEGRAEIGYLFFQAEHDASAELRVWGYGHSQSIGYLKVELCLGELDLDFAVIGNSSLQVCDSVNLKLKGTREQLQIP
ncbi:hypothetical protein AwWohl_12980 [Gammaproteobacteria bacterium]|nr:hypothetical protein AwWohl_12980 [Gammaproteobacteria bacterium]